MIVFKFYTAPEFNFKLGIKHTLPNNLISVA